MIILNIFVLFCFILVNGSEISLEVGSANPPPITSESSTIVFGNDKPQYNCSSSQMTVSGFDIKLSDVVNHECWPNATNIKIFALHKIIIDCDIIKHSAYLSVYAPTWEIIGKQQIILSGKDGEPHSIPTALGNGTSGEPGLPGGAGGNFIGVGEHIINANKLTIEANGGNGGPGQNGANGTAGIDGDELKQDIANTIESPKIFEFFLKESKLNFSQSVDINCDVVGCVKMQSFKIEGKNITIPSGDGGDGGVGGFGGSAGYIHLRNFDYFPNLKKVEGNNGLDGKGGFAGNPGYNGRNVTCSHDIFYLRISFGCEWSDPMFGPTGKNGTDGGNEINRMKSQLPMKSPFSDAIKSFQQFVRINLISNGKESDSTGFVDKL